MILVTGATGFVGRAVMAQLAATGLPARGIARRTLPGLMAVGEINGATDWSAALEGAEVVIHLAAIAHTRAVTDVAIRQVNVEGTVHLARKAAAHGVKRFLYISSVKVNGEQTFGQPFTAEDTPKPEDIYGISKTEAEAGLHAIAQQTGMEVVIIRPPLVYGPGVKANFAMLMRAVQRGVPLPFGAVRNRRSLVYVGNLADLILRCVSHPAAANQTFMVSDGEDISTTQLLQQLARSFKKPSRLLPVPPALMQVAARALGKGDIAQRLLGSLQVDSSKTQHLLEWTPPFSLEQGLHHTVGAFVEKQN